MKKIYLLVLVFSLKLSFSQVNVASSLAACYSMDGNGNEPISGLTGNLSAITPTVDRNNNPNSALSFSGTSGSYVQLPNNNLLKANRVSFSGWISTNVTNTSQIIVFTHNGCGTFQEGYQLGIENIGANAYKLLAFKSTSVCSAATQYSVIGNTTLTANTWYHVGAYFGPDSLKIYVNGALDGTLNQVSTLDYNPGGKVYLGGTTLGINLPFSGSMDNIRFYNRKLNGAEFAHMYNTDPICLKGFIPDASFSYSPNPICAGQTMTLTDLSANTPTAWAWQMTGGTPSVSSVNNPTVVFATTGTYSVSLVSSNIYGPSSPAAVLLISVPVCGVGMEENNLQNSFNFFPNPVNNELNIQNNTNEIMTVSIRDVFGKEVFRTEFNGTAFSTVHLEHLPKGMYFINCKSNSFSSNKKFLKE